MIRTAKTSIKNHAQVLNKKNSLYGPPFTDDLKLSDPSQTILGTKKYTFSLTDVKGESIINEPSPTVGKLSAKAGGYH